MVDPPPAARAHRHSPVLAPLYQDQFATPDPVPLTSFLGRTRELATVTALLGHPDVRLLTLTGPGGSGKSRLALRVMEIVRDTFDDGSAWVSLAPVVDPDLVLPTIAQVLGVPDATGQSLFERVTAFLAERHLLLVLDNLEHLLDPIAPLVVGLLGTCSGLTVLTTSRVRLGVSGERVVPVAPLDAETAHTLIATRAEAADPTFADTAGNAPVIDAICDLLDRLPLAIELAAARVAVLPPPALLARLDHRLDLLTGGPRDAPARLRDMRDAIAWSHDLLPEREQVLFRRLGVFVGGFTLEAAEAVAGEGTEVLDRVCALVAASLVLRVDGVGDEPRFTMLETIREFAIERLGASGEEPSIRERHARHLVALAENLWEDPEWPRMEFWMGRLRLETGNLRLALEWTLQHDPAATVQLAGALSEYWLNYGHVTEGRAWTMRALQACPEAPTLYRARALTASGRLTMIQGEYDASTALLTEAEALLREAIAHSPTVISNRLLTFSIIYLGDTAVARLDLDRARTLFTEARRLAERHGVPIGATIAIMNLGQIAFLSGDLPAAQELLEDALARHQESSGPIGIAHGHRFLGELLRARGKHAHAVEHFHAAFSIFHDIGYLSGVRGALEGLAGAMAIDQPAEAARLLGAAAAIGDEDDSLPDQYDAQVFARVSETTRARLGEPAFAAAWEEGKMLTWDELRARVDALADAIPTVPEIGPESAARHGLTPREIEVLRLIAAGRSNREIAATLFISVPTVKRHVTTILSKLDLPSRSAATAYAHTHALA
jgi:non-specific serine/threonine protein kinase